ncbi:MAG: menaquinone biosynthesis protein [Chloroflexi bacterium]|jgi:chorismate dehydratase|nr:MAG: menaquinone biosynthesis protein [Chloroflexota bacterium]
MTNPMGRLRISAISYLNTAPLMWNFEHGNAGSQFEIGYTIPSACARALREGSADIGIIPAAAYVTIPDLVILPGVAIAAQRAVRSILLVSKVRLEKIRTIALDTSSMTSVALTKVIFAKWLGGVRAYTAMAPNLEKMLEEHDAGLLIGDPALQVDRSRYRTYDLAEEWIRLTGKPFVFAFWAVRRAALQSAPADLDLAAVFQASRNHGLEPTSLDEIAKTWGPQLNLTGAEVKSYLTENIYYYLDSGCLQGLRLFYRYAAQCGALPKAPALEFYELPKAIAK